MRIEEFIALAASEPEKTVTRTVWIASPETLSKAMNPGGLMMTDLLSAPGRHAEQREVRHRHILGAPALEDEIAAWEERHAHALPSDLRDLVLHINGIHLWASVETGRSHAGIAPIEEWEVARIKMYGPTVDRSLLADRYVAVSYHQDGASFVVLDVELGKYFLMDAAGPDATSPIASNVGELLDWLWRSRIAPRT